MNILDRWVQVDDGEAVTLATFFRLNDFTSEEQAAAKDDLSAHGVHRYPIGGGGFCSIKWAVERAAPHTNDVGVLIRDLVDGADVMDVHDWNEPDLIRLYECHTGVEVDASHGFSDLRLMVGGAEFRVSITRIG